MEPIIQMIEEWKDIPGYEGRYQASTFGRIRSFIGNGRILKQSNKPNGYLKVILCKDNIKKTWYSHRLIALTFLQSTIDGYEIDHIDTIRTNNHIANLKICTTSENRRNPLTLPRITKNARKGNAVVSEMNKKKIIQISIHNNATIKSFNSAIEASRESGINYSSIRLVAQGKQKSAGGYKWKYLNK